MIRKIRRYWALFLGVLLVFSSVLPAAARAAESIPASEFGILQVEFKPEGKAEAGISFWAFKIGEVDEETGGYKLPDNFNESKIDAAAMAEFKSLKQKEMPTAAIRDAFGAYINDAANGISPVKTVSTGEDGMAEFRRLEDGLYLFTSPYSKTETVSQTTERVVDRTKGDGTGTETVMTDRKVEKKGRTTTITTTWSTTNYYETVTTTQYKTTRAVPFVVPMPCGYGKGVDNNYIKVPTKPLITESSESNSVPGSDTDTDVRVETYTDDVPPGGGGPTPTPPTPVTPEPTPPTPTPPTPTPPTEIPDTPTPTTDTPTFISVDDDGPVVAADIPTEDLIRILDEVVPLGSLDPRTLAEYVPEQYQPVIRILSELVPLAELESRILDEYVPEGGVIRILGELVPLAELPATEIEPEEVPLAQLPQTGLLWWPVPVMALLGLAFCVLGLAKRHEEEFA